MNEKLRALYKGALQGSTMGLADEAIGGVGALYARALNPELFQGDSFSNTYAQARDLDRAENKQLEQNNPWTYGGANLVGGVAMPMGMAGQGLKGAVKAGGIAGGLTGYGMSENTNPYALALDTATGAGLGAGAGAALYGAGKVATNPQVQKFAKDYIADESGALKLLPDSQNYRIAHTAPLKSGANTLDNISDIYPDDIYNPSTAWRYYGHGGDSVNMDKKTAQIISKYKNNPEAEVTIYRAVPKGVKNINSGDWVTVNKDYAASHGKAHIYQGLSGGGKKEFDIIEKKVKAKNLSTDGNSIHEWGYNADESGALKLFNNNDTTKLYRGLTKEYDPSYNLSSTDAPLGYSTWTDNPELAKQYAGKSGFVYEIELPNNKKGIEMIDKNGERFLFLNNQKKAGLNKISGDEYLIYNYHDDFSPNLIKKYENK